ncbi:MAG: glucosyltransferase domain-containing protein [Nitrospirae bacterium]|nr:glucosyltransferase domain-containing protein [Nitrospirota bacterium]
MRRSGILFQQWRHRLLLIIFFIILLVYGPLLKKHYALDTYVAEAYGNQGEQQIQLGRFLSGALLKIFSALGLNTAVYQIYSTLPSLCLLAVSIYLLIRLFFGLREEWDKKSFLLLCLSCVVSLCNVFMLHWFLFPEVTIFMTAGLLLSISAVFFLRDPGIARWLLCYVVLFAAVSFYQAVGAFFVAFGMLYIAVNRRTGSLTLVFREFMSVFIVYVLAGATNVLFIKLLGSPDGRTDFRHADPIKNMSGIIGSLHDKLQNTNLGAAPVYAFSAFMFFLLVGCGLILWKTSDKKGVFRLLTLLTALIGGSFIAAMAPHLLTSVVDVSPRSIAAIMSLPGASSLYVFLQSHPFRKTLPYYLLLGFLLVFFTVNTYITYRVEISRFATNRLDREIAGSINREILRYEKETGRAVGHIAFRHDGTPSLCYPGLVCYGNFRAMGRDWTVVPILSIVSGRQFTESNMPETIYDSFFKDKQWNVFSKEQIVLQGPTLYLMLY